MYIFTWANIDQQTTKTGERTKNHVYTIFPSTFIPLWWTLYSYHLSQFRPPGFQIIFPDFPVYFFIACCTNSSLHKHTHGQMQLTTHLSPPISIHKYPINSTGITRKMEKMGLYNSTCWAFLRSIDIFHILVHRCCYQTLGKHQSAQKQCSTH